jgi:hypothetical protein
MASRRVAKNGFLAEFSVEDTYLLRLTGRAAGRESCVPAIPNPTTYW